MKILLRLLFTKQFWIGFYRHGKKHFKFPIENNRGEYIVTLKNPSDIIFPSKPFEKYAYQLSLLNTLKEREMITEIEYNKTKQYLKNKYKVA